MFQNENLKATCCVDAKENTVVDNIREIRDILTKTSICLYRLKSFLKATPEEDCCERADTVQDLCSDVAGLRLIALKNLAKVNDIMDLIGLEE